MHEPTRRTWMARLRARGLALGAALLLLAAPPVRAQYTDESGGDHGGADWGPEDGASVGGVHVHVGAFRVPAGATIRVVPWAGGGGSLEVRARSIEVLGTLSADGAGYRGGERPGAAGEGPGGGRGGGHPGRRFGGTGSGGGHGGGGGRGYAEIPDCEGAGAGEDCAGRPGVAYGEAEGTAAELGSGGGAAGLTPGCDHRRGSGGRGGGAIRLIAEGDLAIAGTVSADGAIAPFGDGRCGYRGGGGGGAGGTVVLAGARVAVEGEARANGGPGGTGDGVPATPGCNGFGGGGGAGGRVKAYHGDGPAPDRLRAEGGRGGAGTGCGGGRGAPGDPGSVFVRAGRPDE